MKSRLYISRSKSTDDNSATETAAAELVPEDGLLSIFYKEQAEAFGLDELLKQLVEEIKQLDEWGWIRS